LLLVRFYDHIEKGILVDLLLLLKSAWLNMGSKISWKVNMYMISRHVLIVGTKGVSVQSLNTEISEAAKGN
jgi:hypothetical protein